MRTPPLCLLIVVIIVAVKWYLTVVLDYISLMANDVKQSFHMLGEIVIFMHLEKCLFRSFVFFFFFLAAPEACRNSWARDRTLATAVTMSYC